MKLNVEGETHKDFTICDRCIHDSIRGCMMLDCLHHTDNKDIVKTALRDRFTDKLNKGGHHETQE